MNPGWIFYIIGGISAAGHIDTAKRIGLASPSWGIPVGCAIIGLLFFMADFKRPKRRSEMWLGIAIGAVGSLLPVLA